jgi:hypothetical protein
LKRKIKIEIYKRNKLKRKNLGKSKEKKVGENLSKKRIRV